MQPRRMITRWIVVTLVASCVAAIDGGWLASWAALAPSRIWHGEVWRLATWPFVFVTPWSLVLTCVSIYKLGGDLAIRWGERRLRRFMIQIVVAAGVATCLLAPIARGYLFRLGGWVVADVLLIAWARQFPRETLVMYDLLPLRGRDIVRLTLAVAVVFAIYFGPIVMAPELVACSAAAWYPDGWLRR